MRGRRGGDLLPMPHPCSLHIIIEAACLVGVAASATLTSAAAGITRHHICLILPEKIHDYFFIA
mgnify:CR=1 FL=1